MFVTHTILYNLSCAVLPYNGNRFLLSCVIIPVKVGLGTEFCSERIPRNYLGRVPGFPQTKVLIPSSTEESVPKLGTEQN
jgi:hypothetical protein